MEKARKEQHQSGETWYTEWSSLRGHLEIEGLLLFSPVLLIGPPPQSCWWYAETIWRRLIMLSVKTLNSRSLFCLSSAIRTSLTIPHHTQPRMFASFLHCSPLWVTWQTSVLYSDKLSHFFLIISFLVHSFNILCCSISGFLSWEFNSLILIFDF